jgi:hypothetical protein
MSSRARPLDSWDIVKVVAILLMVVDHVGIFIYNSDADAYWLRAIGRGAAPIFLFLTGYARSYRFSWELFWLALAFAAFDWVYFWHINTLNILFTVLICRMIFNWFESRGRVIQRPAEWFVGSVALFVTGAVTQYGSMGFLLALCGYMRRHESAYPPRLRYGLIAAMVALYTFYQVYFFSPDISPVVATLMIFGVMGWMMRFEVREIRAAWVPKAPLKLLSYYSGYLYVIHIVIFILATGVKV